MKNILIDTNFMLIPAQFGVDIFSELKRIIDSRFTLSVIDRSFTELSKIAEEQKGRLKRQVSMTIELFRQRVADGTVSVIVTDDIEEKKSVDDIIATLSDYTVCTQDVALQRRLKGKGISIIVMRQKRYLTYNS